MAIAEKLTTIAENQQKVYDAGYEKGKTEGGGGGSYDEGYIDGYNDGWGDGHSEGVDEGYAMGEADGHAAGYSEGYSVGYGEGESEGIEKGYVDGQQAENDRLWDSLQNNGNRTDYRGAFGIAWNDDNFKPKYDIRPTNAVHIFKYSSITDLQALLDEQGVVFDLSQVSGTGVTQMFESSRITRLGTIDLSTVTSSTYVFFSALRLHTIEKLIFSEQNVINNTWFNTCNALANINAVEGVIAKSIDLHWSPLTNASVQNIIDCLKDLTGQTTQTLTLKADVGAAVTDAQKATITAKNWTLAY